MELPTQTRTLSITWDDETANYLYELAVSEMINGELTTAKYHGDGYWADRQAAHYGIELPPQPQGTKAE